MRVRTKARRTNRGHHTYIRLPPLPCWI